MLRRGLPQADHQWLLLRRPPERPASQTPQAQTVLGAHSLGEREVCSSMIINVLEFVALTLGFWVALTFWGAVFRRLRAAVRRKYDERN